MRKLFFLLVAYCNGMYAQQLIKTEVPSIVQSRMERSLQKAYSLPIPKWCNTNELMQERKVVIEKCIKTLYHNYTPATGIIFHEGIFPSVGHYDGIWAWDSWKHAYSLAWLDKELAENSVRAMYDYQNETGMIADCIRNGNGNAKGRVSWHNTKSPLSAWAVFEIFKATNDKAFLKEMYPKMLKYHYWWYENRDHDKNGICEYGSTDGSVRSARYECWDNAIRFDSIKMVKNSDSAFSMDIESVDLNAYLYLEKEILIQIAHILKDKSVEDKLTTERKRLGIEMNKLFFNKQDGFYYDVKLNDKSFILSKEASGWLPLFAGVATDEDAVQVKEIMMNENIFNTFLPLPTVSMDNPKYNSIGYWRGSLWLDHFYFGYMGLKKYGYGKEADSLLIKLLHNAQFVTSVSEGTLREYYDSKTGEGKGVQYFGWTAAHLLMMMLGR